MLSINEYKNKLQQSKGILSSLSKRQQKIVSDLENTNNRIISIEEAQAFIQSVAQDTQKQIQFLISDVVQLALDTVFPNKYKFVMNFIIERNRTVCQLKYMRDGCEIDPLSQCGGGTTDVTAFALRIALWSIGKTDNVIILDEPLKNLQPVELNKLGFEVIRNLSKKLGLQFIIVNNSIGSENLLDVSDKVFEVSMGKDGISKVKENNNGEY